MPSNVSVLPSAEKKRRYGRPGVSGAAATNRWLTPPVIRAGRSICEQCMHMELPAYITGVRDDAGRHNDTSDKDRPAHKGGGRSAAMLGIKHGGLLCGGPNARLKHNRRRAAKRQGAFCALTDSRL